MPPSPRFFAAGLALAALVVLPAVARAQANEDCLACHGERDFTTERRGRTVSLYVSGKSLAGSIHGALQCVDCHADLAGKELPHEGRPGKVDCGTCHDTEAREHAASLHGKALKRGDPLAPGCTSCHGVHDIRGVKDPASSVSPLRVPFTCGKCHREGAAVQRERPIHEDHILENYSESIHGEGLLKKGLIVAANCASCHTAHNILPHTDPASSISRANIAKTCTKCHAQIEQVHRKVIRGELWEKEAHVLPACVDCHQPHKIRKVFYSQGMADADCLRCHQRKDLRAGDGRNLHVDAAVLARSRHATVACSQCHSEVNVSHERPCETVTRKVDCGACHSEIAQQFARSRHGKLLLDGDPNAPSCKECHGGHDVAGHLQGFSPTFATNIPRLCARCHREGQKAAVRYRGPEHEIVESYTESIHGKGLLKSGLTVTATCTSCHTAHEVLPRTDPRSTVNRANVPSTCGQCHHGIQEEFEASVHHTELGKTDKELPVCIDCHTAHTIRRADADGFKLDIMQKCGRCHAAIAKTYFDTYHGKVTQLGYTKTAKCYDCHGAHDIRKISDPASHLSRQNVVATCRKCHPGATRRFAGYLTHATHHDPAKYPWLFWTFWGMTSLLIGTFVVGGLHTMLWLPRAFQMRRELRAEEAAEAAAARGEEAPPGSGPGDAPAGGAEDEPKHEPEDGVSGMAGSVETRALQYQRFTRLNRALHALMIVSFISLALTGMTLKFSYTSWAAFLSRRLGGFESAGFIHRAAAVLMFGLFVTHLVDLDRKRRREHGGSLRKLLLGPDSLLFKKRDLTELVGSLRWFVGRGPRPRYGRWTYWEKFDYFAVFWGIFIIGSTGLMLWFPVFFTRFLPGSLINVATIVHSDEALLAAGFIFTVHFFNTHLRPEKFPMDTVVFTGRMPVAEFRRDKPEEYEALVAAGKLEENLVEAYQPVVIRTIRGFAWTALALGSFMVLWIVYAMLFAYR